MTPVLEACGIHAHGLALEGRLSATDFSSPGSEMIALVGPNGGGKTSLLRALARVDGTQGRVSIDGELLDTLGEARRRRLIAFLPASREISWPITVPDVIALGLGRPDPERVEELIGEFELGLFRTRAISDLSTGERARVLLARAMAARPRLLLLDEPLSNLDPYWVLRTLELLRHAALAGATVMLAMHDLGQIERFDRLLLVAEGQLVGDGAPAMLSGQTGQLFNVEAALDGGWQISRPPAGPRSSP